MKLIKLSGSSSRKDGSSFLSANRKGYEISIFDATLSGDSPDLHVAHVMLTDKIDIDFSTDDLATPLSAGTYLVCIRELDIDGRKSSWSDPSIMEIVTATPEQPKSVVIS